MISVLFVDDEPVLVDIGRLFLERAGDFSVTGRESAEEAVELLKNQSFDAIIADYQMPGMNGIDLLRVVRKEYGDIPFILFTGRGREDVAGDAVNIGADFYVQKGGDPKAQFHDIAHKIETAVERRRAILAIKASEQRFYDIINFLPDATFAINTEGAIIAWNREIERITGTPAPEVMKKKNYTHSLHFYGKRRPMILDLLLHPDPELEKTYPSLHREGTMITAEGRLRISDKILIFQARASFLYDQSGKIMGAIESLRDITRQKQSEEKLSQIITRLPVGLQLFRIEPDGVLHCQGGNPASQEVLSMEGQCVPGRAIDEIFPGEEGERIRMICKKIAMEGGRDEIDNVILSLSGTKKRYTIRMFQTESGEVAVLYL